MITSYSSFDPSLINILIYIFNVFAIWIAREFHKEFTYPDQSENMQKCISSHRLSLTKADAPWIIIGDQEIFPVSAVLCLLPNLSIYSH